MVHLKVTLPLPKLMGLRQYDLQIVGSGAYNLHSLGDDVVFEYTAHTILHLGDSEVYKGVLECSGKKLQNEIVCKIVLGEHVPRLKKEAEVYSTALRSVSGTVVPQFVCSCAGVSSYSGEPVACILTAYCGSHFPGVNWSGVSMEHRFKAFQGLLKLHRIGVWHGDFQPCNVVLDDAGVVRIVDFNEAMINHPCPNLKWKYALYQDEPSRCDMRCDEVYDVSIVMDIWTPEERELLGISIPMRTIRTVDDVVDTILANFPSYSVEKARKKADKFADRWNDFYLARRDEAYKQWLAEHPEKVGDAMRRLRITSSTAVEAASPITTGGKSGR